MTVPVPVTIRPATALDADGVWPLTLKFAASFVPVRDVFDASFARLVGAHDALMLVAERPGSGVDGYLLAFVHDTLFANAPVAWVEEVMVDPCVRRSGVGRNLMLAAEQSARGRGASYVALATRRAAQFYSALGYEDSAIMFRRTVH